MLIFYKHFIFCKILKVARKLIVVEGFYNLFRSELVVAALFWEERKIERKLHSSQKLANHQADSFSYYSVIGNLQNMKKLLNIFYDSIQGKII